MKKITAAFLAIIFLFSTFPISVFAESDVIEETLEETLEETDETLLIDNENSNESNLSSDILKEDILSFSCYFDTETQMVNIKGTMNHDAFTSHRASVFVIYAVPPGRNEEDVLSDENIKPLAEASVSITFAFSVKIKNIIDRYSRYAIFMRSPENTYTLTTQAQFAETAKTLTIKNDKTSFKGIAGEYSSAFSNSNSKKSIIPVYLDSIISTEATKYIFQIDENQVFFNDSYIETLDLQIQSLNFSNTDVYLQFLIRPNSIFDQRPNEEAEYILPNTYKYNTITLLHSITAFLSSRYNGAAHGSISGIVLGKAWDNAPKYNSFKSISVNDYINLCGLYTVIVANSAHSFNPNLDIAMSFSADGFLKEENTSINSNYKFSAKDIIHSLMQFFDESSYSGIPCSIFIETNETPLNLSTDDLKTGIDISKELPADKFYIGNQKVLTSFFNELSQDYKSASPYYNVVWIPNENIDGQLLSVAYSFAYYSLLLEKNVTGFIIDFSQQKEPIESISELFYILKNIDIQIEENVTQNALSFFEGNTWAEIFGVEKITPISTNKYYIQDVLSEIPESISGEFKYFDFSNEFLASNWYAGTGCTNIKIDYSSDGIKSLHSDFSNVSKDFCDLIYYYEYSENISYTPYININFEILSNQISPLYEIKFILQNDNNVFESSTIVKGNQKNEVVLDLSEAKDFITLDSLKISLRSLDNTVDSCSLWLYDVTGYSEENSTENLKTLIENAREKIKQEQDEQKAIDHRKTMFLVIGIVVFATLLGIILVMLLRRNARGKSKE